MFERIRRSAIYYFGSGMSLLLIVVIGFMSKNNISFKDTSRDTTSVIADVNQRGFYPHAAIYDFGLDVDIKVKYDSSISIDQSQIVELTYEKNYFKVADPTYTMDRNHVTDSESIAEDVEQRKVAKILGNDITLKLESSGFDIAPESVKQTKGKETPVKFRWTATARNTGDHSLVIDLSQLLLATDQTRLGMSEEFFQVMTSSSVNNKSIELRDSYILILPVTVLTVWNITQRQFLILEYLVALLGFLLMYPLLHDYVRSRNPKKFQSPESEAKTTPPTPPTPQSTEKIIENDKQKKKKRPKRSK